MIQKNSRVEFANGIKFYEQDLLYDDYIYSGSSTISVTLDYRNPGFGIAFIASTSSTLTNNNAVLLFRIELFKFHLCQIALQLFDKNLFCRCKGMFCGVDEIVGNCHVAAVCAIGKCFFMRK